MELKQNGLVLAKGLNFRPCPEIAAVFVSALQNVAGVASLEAFFQGDVLLVLIDCNGSKQACVILAGAVEAKAYGSVLVDCAEVEVALGVKGNQHGAGIAVERTHQLVQAFGLAGALGLGVEVVVVFVHVDAVHLLVGHGHNAVHAGNIEGLDCGSDDVREGGGADPGVDAVGFKGSEELKQFGRDCHALVEGNCELACPGAGIVPGACPGELLPEILCLALLIVVHKGRVGHVVHLGRSHAREPVGDPGVGHGHVHGIAYGAVEPAGLGGKFLPVCMSWGYCFFKYHFRE